MIELFQITGSCSFAARAALEEACYVEEGYTLGGEAVQSHYARVGARPAIARTRDLDDLDERLIRHHPELRAGRPI